MLGKTEKPMSPFLIIENILKCTNLDKKLIILQGSTSFTSSLMIFNFKKLAFLLFHPYHVFKQICSLREESREKCRILCAERGGFRVKCTLGYISKKGRGWVKKSIELI